jgi:tRNA (guanine37-N1)-methyltransferase
MKFSVLSLFPEIAASFFNTSIMARAVDRGLVDYQLLDIRDFALDKHRTCDDAPYGGGAGMVLKAEPLAGALDSVSGREKRVIYPSPSGRPLNQKLAGELAAEDELIFICGRYEGIDQRIIDLYVDDEVSIGDYVISSGELAALVIIDAVYRLLDGVINGESLAEESFTGGLLEYPHYTRPRVFRKSDVPDILLSGNHAEIERWRHEKRLEKTRKYRPELLERENNTEGEAL